MGTTLDSIEDKKNKIKELASLFMHRHYCENDAVSLLPHLDREISWFGAAEQEYIIGYDNVSAFLKTLAGRVPKCDISDETYDVIQPVENIFICSGMVWIATPPSSLSYLRVHQRVTMVFRWGEEGPRCCHLHVSNPYMEMTDDDIGLNEKMSQESRKYFQEQIEKQKKQIEQQHAFIRQMYFEDVSTGLYNRNKFYEVCEAMNGRDCGRLGIVYFDLNSLKRTNDHLGHQAGDQLICRTAGHISRIFGKNAFRIGGDEFLVIDSVSDQNTFEEHVKTVSQDMANDGITIAVGTSWRSEHGNLEEQINEADRNMYLAKRRFYENSENNRRSSRN